MMIVEIFSIKLSGVNLIVYLRMYPRQIYISGKIDFVSIFYLAILYLFINIILSLFFYSIVERVRRKSTILTNMENILSGETEDRNYGSISLSLQLYLKIMTIFESNKWK